MDTRVDADTLARRLDVAYDALRRISRRHHPAGINMQEHTHCPVCVARQALNTIGMINPDKDRQGA